MKPFIDGVLLGAIREGLERSIVALGREMEIRDVRENYASSLLANGKLWRSWSPGC